MAKKKEEPRMGQGLNAIFGDDIGNLLEDIQHGNAEGSSPKMEIPVNEIKPNPYQPRKQFDEKKLQELAESIASHGVFTPILVKKTVQGYELIAGERRLRASKMAGLETIPGILVDFDDQQMMEIALLENIQREDLNAIEEAIGYQKIIERLHYTQEQLAKRIGKSREHVTNMLRLLKLPKSIQEYVVNGELSMGHIRAIAGVEDSETMELLAKQAIAEKMSVRALEALVKKLHEPKKEPKEKHPDAHLTDLQNRLQDKFQTKISLDKKQLVIHYHGVDDLNRILEILDCLDE